MDTTADSVQTNSLLKGDEASLVAAAVRGGTLSEIAAEAGVSISTVQRRLRDPDIEVAICEGRTQQQREAVGRLNADLNGAIMRLRELVQHEDPRVALSAIDKWMAHAHRFSTTANEFATASPDQGDVT